MPATHRIRELNDQLRRTFQGGKIALTQGVLAICDVPTVLEQLRTFESFDKGNDPYAEHDFGAFSYKGRPGITGDGPLLYFKIDYYDLDLQMGSSDPAIPEITARVLTVMLAEEY